METPDTFSEAGGRGECGTNTLVMQAPSYHNFDLDSAEDYSLTFSL